MDKSTSTLFEANTPVEMQEGDMPEPVIEEPVVEEPIEEPVVEENAEPVEEEVKVNEPFDDTIQDIQIDAVRRKRFRINGDNDKIVELDVGDVGVSYRLTEAYDRLNKLMDEVGKKLEGLPDTDDDEEVTIEVADSLKELDEAMKKEIDFIFNSDVAEKCSNGASMYKPYNGMFVYEHIIDVLTTFYESNLNKEFAAMRRRVKETTQRYIGKKKPTKKYKH